MKVAMFAPTAARCGIADYARGLTRGLSGLGVEPEVVAAEGPLSRRSLAERARRLNDADVAHVQYEHGFFLADDAPAENFSALLEQIRVPLAVTVHSMPLDDPRWFRALGGARAFVHSGDHARALRSGSKALPIERAFLPAPEPGPASDVEVFRRAHGLGGRRVCTMFGFTKPHKGTATAVRALASLADDSVLLLAGGPQDNLDRRHLEDVRGLARAEGVQDRVFVTGYLEAADVGAAMQASDIVLAPFESMTASASIAMALAWERPVVASDLPQTAELAEDFGCLQLFPTGDAMALAREIESVRRDRGLARRLSLGARAYRAACSYETLAAQTVALYRRLHGVRARGATA